MRRRELCDIAVSHARDEIHADEQLRGRFITPAPCARARSALVPQELAQLPHVSPIHCSALKDLDESRAAIYILACSRRYICISSRVVARAIVQSDDGIAAF